MSTPQRLPHNSTPLRPFPTPLRLTNSPTPLRLAQSSSLPRLAPSPPRRGQSTRPLKCPRSTNPLILGPSTHPQRRPRSTNPLRWPPRTHPPRRPQSTRPLRPGQNTHPLRPGQNTHPLRPGQNMMVVGYVTRIPIIGAELNSLLQAYTGIYSCIQQRNNGIKGIVWIRHVMRKQEVNDAVQEVVIKQSDMVQEIIIINNSTQPHTACMCPLQYSPPVFKVNTTQQKGLVCQASGRCGQNGLSVEMWVMVELATERLPVEDQCPRGRQASTGQ